MNSQPSIRSRILGITGVFLVIASTMFTVGRAEAIAVYEHLPGTNSNFISHHISNGPVLADDFIPAASGPVNRVEWWGSSAASDSWEITFHTDNAGIPNIDSPVEGGLVQHIPVIASGVDIGGGIFHYTANWNPLDLSVTAGSSYWFSVANFIDDWTWALGGGAGLTIGSEIYDAARSTGSDCTSGGPHCGPWVSLTNTDFAFRISAVPVPAAVWLFGSGLIGLIGIARRNKGT